MIFYLTNAEFPSQKAHVIQICKTAAAFSALSFDTVLTIRKGKENCSQITGITQNIKSIQLKKKWHMLFLIPHVYSLRNLIFYTRSHRWALFIISIGLSKFLVFETHRKALWYHNDPETGENKGIEDKKKLNKIYDKAKIVVVSDPQTYRFLSTKRKNVILLWEGWCKAQNITVKKNKKVVYISKKDISFLEEAFSKICYRNFYIDLFAEINKNTNNIKAKGFLPHDRLIEHLKYYKIGIATQEGIKIADYLEAGLAVIAPKLPSVEFILEKQAIYYKYKNAQSFSNKLNFLLSQPKIVKKLGLNSLKLSRRYLWPTKIVPLTKRLKYSV